VIDFANNVLSQKWYGLWYGSMLVYDVDFANVEIAARRTTLS
jgi:hypothetical protein